MANKNGRKGSAWEVKILNELRAAGYDVERLRLSGTEDEGDLVVRDGHTIIIEAKNEQRINLPGYLRELAEEKANYIKRRGLDPASVEGVVIVKARNQGWDKAYAVQRVSDFFGLEG